MVPVTGFLIYIFPRVFFWIDVLFLLFLLEILNLNDV